MKKEKYKWMVLLITIVILFIKIADYLYLFESDIYKKYKHTGEEIFGEMYSEIDYKCTDFEVNSDELKLGFKDGEMRDPMGFLIYQMKNGSVKKVGNVLSDYEEWSIYASNFYYALNEHVKE